MAALRPIETIGVTVQSLKKAGFSSDPISVFSEPGSYDYEGPMIVRPNRIEFSSSDLRPSSLGKFGNFQNFVQTLRDLVKQGSGGDAIMIVEDDAVFAKNIRPLVEQQIDSGFSGMLSLYTPNIRQFFDVERAGFRTITRELFFGGLALVIPISLAKEIASADTRNWPGGRRQLPGIQPYEREACDAWIGREVRLRGKLIKGWNPSMVSHYCPHQTPEGNSSRVEGKSHTGPRQAKRFIGEETDAVEYFNSIV